VVRVHHGSPFAVAWLRRTVSSENFVLESKAMKTTPAVSVLVALFGVLQPITLAAQATNPPYLREMPPVERVLREITGTDADETAARQMGTFLQFKKIIEKMAGYRFYRNQLTRDETRFIQVYYGAYWDIAKTKPEYQKFTGLKGFDIDPKFRDEVFDKFFSPSFRAQYEAVDAEFARNRAARARADTENMRRAQAEAAAAQQQMASQPPMASQGEERRQLRRCIESGRSETQCLAEGIGKSFKNQFGDPLQFLKKAPSSGLRMGGAYAAPGRGNVGLAFYPEHAIVTCADLEPGLHSYSVAVKDGQARITIESAPKPFVVTLRPDQRLGGPGPVDITGLVQVGVQHGTRTWSDGRTESISRPVYESRTRRCDAGVLAATGPAPPFGSMSSAGGTVLNMILGSPDKEAGKTGPPGLQLTGEYGSQGGFDLEFRPDGVVVGCRDATILRPYTVQVQSSQALVTVQHGAAPFTLALGSDGRLTGSGSVQVDGRAVTGTTPSGELAYAPRSATCALSILPPAQRASTAAAGTPAAPGASAPAGLAGDAVLAIAATAPSAAGAAAPVAGRNFLLLNDDLTTVLTQGGFQAAPGNTALRTLAMCQPTDANCQKGMTAMLGHVVAATRSDAGGKAAFPGVAPGTYYLVGTTGSNDQPILWNLKVQLKAGDNTMILDQGNAVLIP
jgi:hypothetical protein